MRKGTKIVLATGAAVLIGIQFVPAGTAENPPVETEIAAVPEVMQVLERSCYDCHSNETKWPRYGNIAPAKWLIRHDVEEGREHLNFSTWNRYDAEERADKLEEIAEELDQGKMPPWFYLPLHPAARLTESEAAMLRRWAARRPAVASGVSGGERQR